MTRKTRKLAIIGILLLFTVIGAALSLRYLPFSRLFRMPSASPEAVVASKQVNHILPPNTLAFDFEVAAGKEMPGGFYKGLAHSGNYSVKAFGQNSFSVAVERTAGEIGTGNLGAVALSAWVYVFPTDNEVKGSLVFTASNELGVNVCWQGVGLRDPEVPRGKWFKVSGLFDLSSVAFKPEYKLQVYFWNTSRTDILVDDFFIVFGKAPERTGDTTLVDLTAPGGWQPKANFPPFPVTMLTRDTVAGLLQPDAIGREDLAIAGNFFGRGGSELLVITRAGTIKVYSACPGKGKFTRVSFQKPVNPVLPARQLLKGDFMGRGHDQLVVVTGERFFLFTFEQPKEICSQSPDQVGTMSLAGTFKAGSGEYLAADFTGSGASQLLRIGNDGSWELMNYEYQGAGKGEWKSVSGNGTEKESTWDKSSYNRTITSGSFLPGHPAGQLLTVSLDKQGKRGFSILKYNMSGRVWQPLIAYPGETVGLDTLMPGDRFLFLSGRDGKTTLLKYNRDWRFDLKEIRFAGNSFSILTTVDFSGYFADRNPKYYERLELIPGEFPGKGETLLLVSGKNSPEHKCSDILPDFIQFYAKPSGK